ncbi:MAG: hypothetical protein PHY08_14040 [Candidatus Cloacimonetes bacterium]|nr:hypothetical protein [Candidatus Cloacimonadota bacterium]
MERLENLTMSQLAEVSKVAESEGYKETQSIESIPEGACTADVIVNTTKDKGKTVKSPSFALIKFERKDKEGNDLKLKFEAVKLNVLHVSTGKTFNDVYAKLTPELKTALEKPENWSKEMQFTSSPYVDSQKRQRTILKFDSISK